MTLRWPFARGRSPATAPPDGAPKLAVLGAMRSGTNLVRRLVETHWDISAGFSSYGWKHAGVPIFSPDSGLSYPSVPILFVVKNPYAFVVSLFRYRMLAIRRGHRVSVEGGETLETFLTGPITVFDSQLPGSPRLRFANPVQYWNFVYCNLETLDPGTFRAHGINYEDLLADPETLRVVEKLAGLPTVSHAIRLPAAATGRDTDRAAMRGGRHGDSFDASYYRDHRYLEELSPDQTAFIGDQVDPWLMQRRGYRRF